ncbi:MAG TPA: DUF2461 domain-containing protein [Bacteroidales bacterium]|nr:DUF2461 domain-containing protein [Bacteroidales bacterium]
MEAISQQTLDFLKKLKKNNDREWFNRNRKLYDSAKSEFEKFIDGIIREIARFDPILRGLEASSCMYRINRDIRFSNDKSPYKSHLGAFITRGGRKNGEKYAGYYIHIEPGAGMIAGGAYMPPAPWLNAIRAKIDNEPERLIKILKNKDFVRYFGELQGEKLKKTPRGYEASHPQAELLKHKSYLVVNSPSDSEVTGPSYFSHVISVARAMKPLNDFLNDYEA